jgi:hypothetical protein
MSNTLIFETLNDVKSMKATRDSNGFMHLEGVFGVCGKKNNNQRIYQKDNYAKMVESLQKRIETEGCPGELEHPSTMNITLENVSHKIDSISIDENGVVSGSITLLDTPKGKIAQAIVEGGLPLFISSRAQGNVDQRTGIVTLENLKTFDLVGSPGFSEARLHIHLNEGQVLESITDNCYMISEKENKEPDNMTNEEQNNLEVRINQLDERCYNLERENRRLKQIIETSNNDLKQWALTDLSNGIEKWITEVYQPEIVDTVTEALAPAFQKWVVEEFSPEVEKWIVEEFSPEVEKWLVEHYSPEVEKWIVEDYSTELQNWLTEQFSPEIEKWIVEQYSEGVQGWINEELKPEIQSMISESKKTSLDSIDQTLAMLESTMPKKPVYSRKQTVVGEGAEPVYIQKMPEEKRVKWNLLNEDVKEMVRRRASLRDLTSDAQIESFWESIDFDSIKPAKPITEGLESIADDYERQLRQSIRGWRRG